MGKGIGRLIKIGIAKDSSRGTAAANPVFNMPWDDFDFDEQQAQIQQDQSNGLVENSLGMTIVKKWAEGKIKAPVGDNHIGLILLSLFGTCTTSDNADSNAAVKDHLFTVQQGCQHQSLGFFIDDPVAGQDYVHPLGMISALDLSYERGAFVKYAIDIVAKKGTAQAVTPAASTDNLFTSKHVIFKIADTAAGLGAASAFPVKSLSLTIKQDIVHDDVLGSDEPSDFVNTEFSVEGELEATWQNESDFKTAFLAGTQKALRIDIKNTDVTIGATARPELVIDLAKVHFQALSREVKLGDMVMQKLKFKAYYSTTDTKMISATLTNITASY